MFIDSSSTFISSIIRALHKPAIHHCQATELLSLSRSLSLSDVLVNLLYQDYSLGGFQSALCIV